MSNLNEGRTYEFGGSDLARPKNLDGCDFRDNSKNNDDEEKILLIDQEDDPLSSPISDVKSFNDSSPIDDKKSAYLKNILDMQNNQDETNDIFLENITMGLTRATANNANTKNSMKRKQIQFNLDRRRSSAANPIDNNNISAVESQVKSDKSREPSRDKQKSKQLSFLHERLNQLKLDELKKKRYNSSEAPRKKPERKKTSFCNLKNFLHQIGNLKAGLYALFERPTGKVGFFYNILSFTIILVSILIGTLTTVKSMDEWSLKLFYHFEIFVTIYFGTEFILRVWSSGQKPSYEGFYGRLKFMTKTLLIFELCILVMNVTLLSFIGTSYGNEKILESGALSLLRFVQIFRFLLIDRQAQTWKLLAKVIYKHRFELLTSVYIGVIILLFSSYFILIFEKDANDSKEFHSFADAVYWSIITMTTIGYGDKSPKTSGGKVIATGLCIVGVAFWTLPGGIIGSGFALKVEQRNKKKQFDRLLPAAATLIQTWWRMKATLFISSSNSSCLAATVATFDLSKPMYSTSLRRLKKHLDSTSSGHNEIFSGLDSQYDPSKNKSSPTKSTGNNENSYNPNFTINSIDGKEVLNNLESEKLKLSMRQDSHSTNSKYSMHYSHSSSASQNEESILLQLSPEHLILIRTILLLKFFAAKHKFKQAFKPYDFKDVIEQYTQGNMDILLKMKDLQRKIEQVSNQSSLPTKLYQQFSTENGLTLQSNSPMTLTSQSPNLNSNRLRYDPLSTSPVLPIKQFNTQLSQPASSSSWSNDGSSRNSNRKLIKNRSIANEISNQQTDYNLYDKVNRIENELDNLSRKLDKLLDNMNKKV